MTKKILTLFLLISSFLLNAQSQTVNFVTAGGSLDYTNQPISTSSQSSHSQTIYYPDQLQFTGTINSLTYFLIFNVSLEGSSIWNVRLGMTTQEEFSENDGFIPQSELTQVVTNGTITVSGTEVTINFTEPFEYDGQSNLVIDVEEVEPGNTPSNFAGFVGVENFGNPPTRSIMSFSGEGVVKENSFAKVKFGGNFEKCLPMHTVNFTDLSATSVYAEWANPDNIPAFRYNVSLYGEPIPETYDIISDSNVTMSELTPATYYNLSRKADCDVAYTNFSIQRFVTRPLDLTVPSLITFDGENTHNYLLPIFYKGSVSVSPYAAADNSENGMLFSATSNYLITNTWSYDGDPFESNPSFITNSVFSIDLTNYAGNPAFKFDLKQKTDSKLRLRIDGFLDDFVYSANPDNDDFQTVVVDLSDKIGKKFDIVMEHVGRRTPAGAPTQNCAFIDNVKLEEACGSLADITAIAGTYNITVDWTSEGTEWEVIHVLRGETPPNSGTLVTEKPYTLSDLLPATAYDIYVRQHCETETSPWHKIYASTDPLIIQVPHEEICSSITEYISPQYNNSSAINFYNNSHIILNQREKGDIWIGDNTATEAEVWNDNKEFTTGLKLKVNAANLLNLQMVIRMKQQYFYSAQSSWFRITVNGVQYGSSRNPTQITNEPFINLTYDLSEFVGEVLYITLEHCGRRGQDYSNFSVMDATRIDNILFTGDEDPDAICGITPPVLQDITNSCQIELEDIIVPTVTDNCGNLITPVTDESIFPITLQGTTTITWEYSNEDQNITQTQNIIIQGIAPVPDVATLPDFTTQCEVNSGYITPPTATDSCGNIIEGTTTASFPITEQGTTVITWLFTDAGGMSVSQEQNILIEDTEAPEPENTTLPDITAQCSVALNDITQPFAFDCAGPTIGTTSAEFPITESGTTVITWTFDDGRGNISYQNQNIIIDDTQAPTPVLAVLPDIPAQCIVNSEDIIVPEAIDNCSSVIVNTSAQFPIDTQGTTVITWVYEDANGNTSSQTQNIIIDDTQAPIPVLAVLPDITAQCIINSEDITLPEATDNCSSVIVNTSAQFPIDAQGTTIITWIYEDASGNTSSQTQNIVINDTEPPTIILQDFTGNLDEDGVLVLNIEDLDNGSYDDCSVITWNIIPDSFNCDNLGEQAVTVTATDSNGNVSTGTAAITVTDTNNSCDVTASEKWSTNKIKVFPNPVKDMLYISSEIQINDIQIFSVTGQQVYNEKSTVTNGSIYSISLSGLASGIYIINIRSDKGALLKKIIKF